MCTGAGNMNPKAGNLEWWKQSVIYQVYPRSFKDSTGDGVGDLNGIRKKLDYFLDLGVEAIWICPFFKSPMKDFGYDVSDFTDVDPIFGTIQDFKQLAAEMKNKGLKLILDIVPNHSSDQHEWFQKSVDRIKPYTDYYVWKDAKAINAHGNSIPPTNWVSVFGGSMWEWNEKRQQFYLHQFVKEQPDLNYENNLVREEMFQVFKFWLDAGVDGFRIDAVPHMFEDQRFLDETPRADRLPEALPTDYRYWNHTETYNSPKVLHFLAEVRKLIDAYSATDGSTRCMMVEATVTDPFIMSYYGTPSNPIAHFPFNFKLLKVRPEMNAAQVLELINTWFRLMPNGEWATFLIGNHDKRRAATRWTEANIDGANMINLLLQGTAVTYYGEEIGMIDKELSWEETVDPYGRNAGENRYQTFSRDPARTPMQWDSSISAGFSTNPKPWLPIHENYTTVNVRTQLAADQSHLKLYKELVKLRYTDAWRYGAYNSLSLNKDTVLAFTRIAAAQHGGGGYLVLVSFSDQTQVVKATELPGVPAQGKVLVKSVNFSRMPEVGDMIPLNSIQIESRTSIVIELSPLNRYQAM